MRAAIINAYRLASHALLLLSLAWVAASLANQGIGPSVAGVPRSAPIFAMLTDTALILLVLNHHCLLADPQRPRWWPEFVAPHWQAGTCMLISSFTLILMLFLWQPIPRLVWLIETPVLRFGIHVLFLLGWLGVLASAVLLASGAASDLANNPASKLAKSWQRCWQRLGWQPPPAFINLLYPAWLLALWCTPEMTFSHLVLAMILSTRPVKQLVPAIRYLSFYSFINKHINRGQEMVTKASGNGQVPNADCDQDAKRATALHHKQPAEKHEHGRSPT